jgi:para-nitrobenzyl esterase
MKSWILLLALTGLACVRTPSPRPVHQTTTELAGTSWKLVKFEGGDGTVLTPAAGTEYTLAFAADGRLSARIDCNRGAGSWKSSAPGMLELGPLALTRAMCPPGSLHDPIVRQWPYVRSYVVRGGRLYLSLMADGGIFELEPLPVAGS